MDMQWAKSSPLPTVDFSRMINTSKLSKVIRVVGLTVLWLLASFSARAHDPGLSALALQLRTDSLRVDLSMALGDVRLLVPSLEAGGDGHVLPQTLEIALPQLRKVAEQSLDV